MQSEPGALYGFMLHNASPISLPHRVFNSLVVAIVGNRGTLSHGDEIDIEKKNLHEMKFLKLILFYFGKFLGK